MIRLKVNPVILILVWQGFGLDPPELVRACLFFAAGLLAGRLSPLPGGLGVTELSLAALVQQSLAATPDSASVAMAIGLVFRATTLLFSVVVGLLVLGVLYLLIRVRPLPLAGHPAA